MKRMSYLLAITITSVSAWVTVPVAAQEKPGSAVVSIYRVAPGKHLEFMKWMAAREASDRGLGIPVTQWYSHQTGDSWDYVAIAPDIDDAMSDKSDAAASKQGLATGMRASLEFRQLMGSHTDTIAMGPYTAEQIVAEAGR
ncbi:MAG: hypothetical protein H7Y19_17220 [Luteimonas sp.]|nr:hypothetical protein [Luteimonas sp.]